MPEWTPATQPVPVRVRIPGQPERVVAGTEQPNSLPETNVNAGAPLPQFDPNEHARLFRPHMINGKMHYQQPQFLTARQILKTHILPLESLHTRESIFNQKQADLKNVNQNINFDDDEMTAVNSVSSYGGGRGHGVTEGLTAHGWDWNRPIPLAIDNVGSPTVANGQHRLMYMWQHHPDVPMPVEMQQGELNHWITDEHGDNSAHKDIMTTAYNNPSPENLSAVSDFEKNAAKQKRDSWFAKMAAIGLPKTPVGKDA